MSLIVSALNYAKLTAIGLLLLGLASNSLAQTNVSSIDFGDDGSSWANDQECDDPRFGGDGMASTLVETDQLHDASDCRKLFLAGSIFLLEEISNPDNNGIDFGDDSSIWADDGECDDPRFQGDGMASVLDDGDRLADASDCRLLFQSGSISLVGNSTSERNNGVDFGDNSSTWSFDGQCDDPRSVSYTHLTLPTKRIV